MSVSLWQRTLTHPCWRQLNSTSSMAAMMHQPTVLGWWRRALLWEARLEPQTLGTRVWVLGRVTTVFWCSIPLMEEFLGVCWRKYTTLTLREWGKINLCTWPLNTTWQGSCCQFCMELTLIFISMKTVQKPFWHLARYWPCEWLSDLNQQFCYNLPSSLIFLIWAQLVLPLISVHNIITKASTNSVKSLQNVKVGLREWGKINLCTWPLNTTW